MFSIDTLVAFGLLSALLSAFAFLPYAIDTLRGITKPQRAAWFIWSVLASISFVAQLAEGATHSLYFAGVQTTGTLIIFTLSIKNGVGGFVNWTDVLVLLGAGAGLCLWTVTDEPVYALAISIGISSLAGIVAVAKAARAPKTETCSKWRMCLVASMFAMCAVGELDWLLLAYPLYLFTLNFAMVIAITLGRRRDGMLVQGGSVA